MRWLYRVYRLDCHCMRIFGWFGRSLLCIVRLLRVLGRLLRYCMVWNCCIGTWWDRCFRLKGKCWWCSGLRRCFWRGWSLFKISFWGRLSHSNCCCCCYCLRLLYRWCCCFLRLVFSVFCLCRIWGCGGCWPMARNYYCLSFRFIADWILHRGRSRIIRWWGRICRCLGYCRLMVNDWVKPLRH